MRTLIGTVIADLKRAGVIRFDLGWPVVLLRGAALLALGVYLLTLFWAPNSGIALGLGAAAVGLATVAVCAPPARLRGFSAESFEVRDHLHGLHDYIALAEAERLGFVANLSANLPLPEMLAGLRGLDVDVSLLTGIQLPEIDLGALSLDL